MPRQLFRHNLLYICLWIIAGMLLVPQALLGKVLPVTPPQDPACFSHQGWPHEHSDLPVDPTLIFGTLDNGLRYILKKNSEPRNRVAMYLNIQAGSLQETEEQRGLAHFLEHMLFNGTTHYSPGTLVEYFQSIGMDFGADTNAHTSYDETVYKLILPAADEKTLGEGLLVLADFAQGALLLENEVDRERGIIVAEKRDRDSAGARVRKAQLAFDFTGTLVAERDPIGTDASLRQANASRLRAYYDNWYRPDNMFVVIVGDMDTSLVERLLRQQFSELKTGAASSPVCPDYGAPVASGVQMRHLAEPELGYTEITLSSVQAATPGPDTLRRETAMLHRYLALVLLNNRLQHLERETGGAISKTMAFSGNFIRQFNYNLLTTRTESKDWKEGLHLLQKILEQSLRYGFTQAELERGKKEVRAMLEKEAQTADARDSRNLALELIRNLNDHEVSLSPAQKNDIFLPLLQQSSLNAVNQALHDMWPPEPRTVSVAGTAMAGLTAAQAEEEMQALYAAAVKAEVAPWQDKEPLAFPYLQVPDKNEKPVRKRMDTDIDVQHLEFANGLIAQVKKTDFQPKQVGISVHFGQGRQAEPWPGAALLAQGVVKESGTATMSREQLQQALAGHNITLDFAVGPESFSFNGSALSSELELLLQLLYARLHDPGFRQDAFAMSKEQLRQMYTQMEHSVEGVHQLKGEPFLSGGSRFYSMPAWEELETVNLEQLSGWLLPIFKGSPLEINIVGDIEPDQVRHLLSRYFGAEKRGEKPRIQEKTITFPHGQTLRLQAPSSSGKAQLTIAWQTDDFWNIDRTRGLNMLAKVLDDRLRLKIREELGAAYSPQVFNLPSKIDTGFGLLESRLIIDPAQTEQLAQVVHQVAADLVKEGITAEEFKRAQEPTLTAIREQMRSNTYWLHTVLSLSSRHPEQLEWPKTILQDFTAMKRESLDRLAKQYLQPEQAATVLVLPKK